MWGPKRLYLSGPEPWTTTLSLSSFPYKRDSWKKWLITSISFSLKGKAVSASILLTEIVNGKVIKYFLMEKPKGHLSSFMTTHEFFFGCTLRTGAMSAGPMPATDPCAKMTRYSQPCFLTQSVLLLINNKLVYLFKW